MSDVIAAFIDNEPFDPAELAAALSTPEGRDELLDLIALRDIAQPAVVGVPSAPPKRTPRTGRGWFAAAAVVLAAGGYVVGRGVSDPVPAPEPAPTPTLEIRFEPGTNWQEGQRF